MLIDQLVLTMVIWHTYDRHAGILQLYSTNYHYHYYYKNIQNLIKIAILFGIT